MNPAKSKLLYHLWSKLSTSPVILAIILAMGACSTEKKPKKDPASSAKPFDDNQSQRTGGPDKVDVKNVDEDDDKKPEILKNMSTDEMALLEDFACKYEKKPETVVALSKYSSKDLEKKFDEYDDRDEKKEKFEALKTLLKEIDGDSDKAEEALKALCKKS